MNIKLKSTTKAAATAIFEIIARATPSGDAVNDIIADMASPLPKSGIAYNPTEPPDRNIEPTPIKIINIIKGVIIVPASFTLFDSVDITAKTEIITKTTEIIKPKIMK